MENSKQSMSTEKTPPESRNLNSTSIPVPQSDAANTNPNPNPNPRTPFTSLDQVDADLALARALQEQERAYMMLGMEGVEGYSEPGSYVYDDEFEYEYVEGNEGEGMHEHEHLEDYDIHNHEDAEHAMMEGSNYGEDAFYENNEELNPADFENDESFARALQDVEARGMAVRLMGLAGGVIEHEGHVMQTLDGWQEVDVDPDQLSYEELVALGNVVGTESRGLSADTIASLPSVNYKAQSYQDGNTEQCVVCRLEYENGESLVSLSCKHLYHPECISQWLQINKHCICEKYCGFSEITPRKTLFTLYRVGSSQEIFRFMLASGLSYLQS